MKHNRKNKPDQHHHPWVYIKHCYGGGHRGAAKGRAASKRNARQRERIAGKQELTEILREESVE